MKKLIFIFVLLATPAFAQQVVIDRDLWQALARGLADISMPLNAHQQAQQLMQGIEQEAAKRAAVKKPEEGK